MNADAKPAEIAPPGDGVVDAGRASNGLVISRAVLLVLGATVLLALLVSGLLWQRLGTIQEQLARQSAESGAQAIEARSLARQASELARETAARQAVNDAKLAEATLQRTQLEELMQSLSRSRDENLVVDIESAVRLAQQQAQLTGSLEPLLSALKAADQRVVRAAQPRLTNLQRAIARDLARIQATALSDTPALLVKLDELARAADDLPLANAVGESAQRARAVPVEPAIPTSSAAMAWWQESLQAFKREARSLLRVSRIEQPEAMLLSPEQAFFVRENLKLKILNARLGLLARQLESSRADLGAASTTLAKYFDMSSRKTQGVAALLVQVRAQMGNLELPRVDETLSALTTAAAGR